MNKEERERKKNEKKPQGKKKSYFDVVRFLFLLLFPSAKSVVRTSERANDNVERNKRERKKEKRKKERKNKRKKAILPSCRPPLLFGSLF